ncbi:hypothetical protein J3Q64DRAFT_1725337 [Phycomyces blakesleeanus]|uniref:N-acetyltransferase domain-containing protein n=2 Tax=Phycomyces blakesleeanus TaxID=4837 RepID=A0A163EPS4_PHYB8|nr:hypothetical protein PHYBLDRAFT_178720 [Phycomyces blakesleeanus NRRL 1555(-)]OAD80700.1 hypothetical protein PHYBLDRAFT_178720 [Phycomyces blakesleeanus NRRL 1555(-)]|eukprot:XP_018298740.1 hypothetical protein PHYBLDRAFT_178720 [Phycomyces blakesleeanus NRRL 1555(-)]
MAKSSSSPSPKSSSTKNNSQTTSVSPSTEKRSQIELRPFFDKDDLKYAQFLFYSTYLDLVPYGVKLRVQSPIILGTWLALFAFLFTWVPSQLSTLGWTDLMMLSVRVLIVIVSIGGGLITLLWYVDKFDVSERVLEGIDNDLKDPPTFYRGEPDQPLKGNFWVLTINGEPVGCVGMDQHLEDVIDKRATSTYLRATELPKLSDSPAINEAEWEKTAKVLAKIDDTVRLVLVGATDLVCDSIVAARKALGFKVDSDGKKERVLFKAHKPNEASVRRLAIKSEYQGHGLSTVLLKRVALWAHSHQIEYLYAETNELQDKMAEVLEKRHGYTRVSTKKEGYIKTKTVWKLDVKLWMSKYLQEKKDEVSEAERKKEEEELKEYE